MSSILWTVAMIVLAIVTVKYMIHLLRTRKENLDFPNHMFVTCAVLAFSLIMTTVDLYDLTLKWTGHAPVIEGPCTVSLGGGSKHPQKVLHFEEKTLYADVLNKKVHIGDYQYCSATYMPISEKVIKVHLEYAKHKD